MSGEVMRVTWVDYTPKHDEGGPAIVRLCGRSADGERMQRYIRGCRPHCYVPAETDLSRPRENVDIMDVETGFETYDGVPVKRVELRHPKEVNTLDDMVPTFESDIPFYRRVSWDHGLTGYVEVPPETNVPIEEVNTDITEADLDEAIHPKVVIGDIEVVQDGSKSFAEMQDAVEDPVIAVTLYDTWTEEFVLVVVDPEGMVEGSAVKGHLDDHWEGHDLASKYTSEVDIELVRTQSEVELFEVVINRVRDMNPDLLSGWNWIDFDHKYLTERAELLDGVDHHRLSQLSGVGGRKVETSIKGLPGFDQLAAYDDKVNRSESRSLSLEYVASEELGVGKLESVDIWTAYQNDRSRLAAYNLLDVQLCAALTDKHDIEGFYADLADLSGILTYDAFYEKRLVDGWVASRADDDQVLPNQTGDPIPEPAGGIVLSPSDGIKENVAVLDLKSLYPSSIISCNISPETMTTDPDEADVVIPGMPEKAEDVGGSIEPSDVNWDDWDEDLSWSQRPKGFTLEEQGIISEAAEGPFVERARYKDLRDQHDVGTDAHNVYDRKQGAVKVVHNSMYGVLNSDYYRLATPGLGDAITGVSRYVLWRAAEYCRDRGYDVVYGDTDSVLIKFPEDKSLEDCILDAKGLNSELNDHMSKVAEDLGIPGDHPHLDGSLHDDGRHAWLFEFEKFYGSFFQAGSKKRYAGNVKWYEGQWVDDVDVTGFESERSDVPEITAEAQTGVIQRVLDGESFVSVSKYVQGLIERVRDAEDLSEIGVPKSISKPIEEYPPMPRVRAVKHSNKHLGTEFDAGDTPWMYFVERVPAGRESTDVIALDWDDEIPEGYDIDKTRTVNKSFESALKPVLQEVGWSFSEVRSGLKRKRAEESTDFEGDPFSAATSEGSDSTDDDGDASGVARW